MCRDQWYIGVLSVYFHTVTLYSGTIRVTEPESDQTRSSLRDDTKMVHITEYGTKPESRPYAAASQWSPIFIRRPLAFGKDFWRSESPFLCCCGSERNFLAKSAWKPSEKVKRGVNR